jgi:hypothetical protein
LPENPDILEGVDDLIQLSYLNEPSVLHNLQHRFSPTDLLVPFIRAILFDEKVSEIHLLCMNAP